MQINKKAFDEATDETCEEIIELNKSQGQKLRKLIERYITRSHPK